MQSVRLERTFKWFDAFELSICVYLNRAIDWKILKYFFIVISRLGNGVLWYVLMILMAIYDFPNHVTSAIHMASVGLLCVTIYKLLKSNMVRQRPYLSWDQIRNGTAPLDLYSFPSGHTLHAVAFCIVAIFYFPLLAWFLIPFTMLVALSRVVLGLHYPTDVFVGTLIGALIACSSFLFF